MRARKGRGAVSNASGRFEPCARVAVDDGWPADDDAPPPRIATEVTMETVRTVISHNASPDLPFDRSINPYRGCEHGCVYCYARPSHAYLGLSPGLDFESRLFAKPGASEALARELSKPGYRVRPIMVGANTDPYQPIEGRLEVTRGILRVLDAFSHPVMITTKSDRIVRDLDLLGAMARRGLVSVAISLTTLGPTLARTLEPRAPTPSKRLTAIERLSAAGVPLVVLAAPMIPCVNDHELERILKAARDAGAVGAGYAMLRLPLELKDIFTEWLDAHVPGKTRHVLSLLRQSRKGALYDPSFATRMRGAGPHADLLAQRFAVSCRRLGLSRGMPTVAALRGDLFAVPPRKGDQLSLF
ncbi:PA0069 family radical SAM protein [Varunaivibrio sulfuroxidans]|uniref:DNA repair photolyase n=1 Tax=Varunaivibrio sulfuroxidans TaxID=1773489 RepID=A0A4R3JC62_9PROT|nr:PA0069 family radical SAM protein [Varunaivibrio sulfuroxidans]TCS63548.1 DNA repair photolyase [Varunaivibrio sulfuroxidans]WES30307.1 PA0069 family radical SAM protein [Varunaivibrio sulfuroxidans]